MDNSQYFYRNIIFSRKNEQISLADINEPGNITPFDSWIGIVVLFADGQHTIQEFIDHMKKQYPTPPENIEQTLHSVIERLEEGKIVLLAEEKVDLPYYMASPIEELDIEKAREQLQEDREKNNIQ